MSTVPICSQRYLRRLTKQPKLTAIIQSCRFTLFGHNAHTDDNHRCQDDPVSLPSGGLEKITRTSPHHVAQHRPTGSEKPPPYAPQSSRFGSEPPSVDDDVDVWCYTILELHAKNNDDSVNSQLIQTCRSHYVGSIKIKVLMSYVKRYDLMMTFVIYTTHQKMVFLLIWQSYRKFTKRCTLFESSSSRMHVINHNWSASSSAECSRNKPPFSFVREQDSTM